MINLTISGDDKTEVTKSISDEESNEEIEAIVRNFDNLYYFQWCSNN